MIDTKKEELFNSVAVPRAVLSLAVPTIISSLVMILYNLADTYFVGMLNNSVQNAAVALAAPVLLAFNAVNNLFGVGASSMMSRGLGRGDMDTVRRSSAFGFFFSLLCGLLFSLSFSLFKTPLLDLLGTLPENYSATSDYLKWTVTFGAIPSILNVVMAYLVRSEGATVHAGIGTISGCLLNILLDPFFILPKGFDMGFMRLPFGFDMGAQGAGLATFISNCVACLYFFVLLFIKRGKTCVCLSPSKALPQKAIVVGVLAVGIPASIQNILNVTGMTILNNFTSAYGSDAVAAMGIAQKVAMVPMYMAMGFSQGIMPLVSYTFAARKYRRMKSSIRFSALVSVGAITLVTALIFILSEPFIGMFMKSEEVVSYGGTFLKGLSLALPFLCLDFLAVGIFQACGMGAKSLIFACMRKIVLEIPALFILNALFPPYGIAYAQFAAELVMAVLATVVLLRLFARYPSENDAEPSQRKTSEQT